MAAEMPECDERSDAARDVECHQREHQYEPCWNHDGGEGACSGANPLPSASSVLQDTRITRPRPVGRVVSDCSIAFW